jgi:hypothetical protein
MIDDPIVSALAECDPVRELPAYDDAAERQLHRLLNSTAPVRRQHVRRGWATAVGVGVVVVVAAGVLLVNRPGTQPAHPVATGPSTGTRASAAASGTARRFPTADATTPIQLVVDRTAAAMNSASDYILKANQVDHFSTGVSDPSASWQDEGDPTLFRTEAYGASGQPILDEATCRQGGALVRWAIDYRKREWAEVPDRSTVPVTTSQTQVVINDLRQGHDEVLGTDTVNGRPALHLGNDEPGMGREIWVDPSTYLLIRMTDHGSFGSTELDYTWIPKSDPNADGLFAPQVPAGFTKVPKIQE